MVHFNRLKPCHLPMICQPSTPESNIEVPNTGVTPQPELSEDEMEPWVSYRQEFSMNSRPDQQSVSSESVSEQGSEPQDHHGQENVTAQPEATRGGSVSLQVILKAICAGLGPRLSIHMHSEK